MTRWRYRHGHGALLRRSLRSRRTLRRPFPQSAQCRLPRTGSNIAWLLTFGYLITLAAYGYTFGRYAAHLFGLPEAFVNGFAILILLVFVGINLRDVGASAVSEDLVVPIKVALLALIAAIGFAHSSPERLAPLADKGTAGVIVASASIFVAYEGFELLSYDYVGLERLRWTLPRALYLSGLSSRSCVSP
ncbi:amino acid permease [Arthrobacter alpinus]|uniref:amino acid permease n=1 Tax=Arthrobacter alpinus TaxID=656366 RepID=UPI0016490A95|nr:amino acid permease [Arthrobacter alpinus]